MRLGALFASGQSVKDARESWGSPRALSMDWPAEAPREMRSAQGPAKRGRDQARVRFSAREEGCRQPVWAPPSQENLPGASFLVRGCPLEAAGGTSPSAVDRQALASALGGPRQQRGREMCGDPRGPRCCLPRGTGPRGSPPPAQGTVRHHLPPRGLGDRKSVV